MTEHLTGRPLLLKRLSKSGTLACFNVDFELAQVLGIGDSFLSTNEPEYSKIPADINIETLVQYFVRGCLVHAKRYSDFPFVDVYQLTNELLVVFWTFDATLMMCNTTVS